VEAQRRRDQCVSERRAHTAVIVRIADMAGSASVSPPGADPGVAAGGRGGGTHLSGRLGCGAGVATASGVLRFCRWSAVIAAVSFVVVSGARSLVRPGSVATIVLPIAEWLTPDRAASIAATAVAVLILFAIAATSRDCGRTRTGAGSMTHTIAVLGSGSRPCYDSPQRRP
jgi:hypothetical protein